MKANSTAPEIPHPPLARDANGNHLPVPSGTAAWRICRHTEGRPRIIKGPDRQPARFALDTTLDDLVDQCGPDRYHIYALDAVGEVIVHVATLDAGIEQRNAAEAPLTVVSAARGSAVASDWRYALETIAQIARTNAEAMRAVAESQAEWIKSISSARGFFRNAPQLALPAPEPKNDEEEEEDSDIDEEPAQNKTMYDVLAPLAEHLAPAAAPFVAMLASGTQMKAAKTAANAPATPTAADTDLASRPSWELRDFVDLNYASAKAKAKKAAKEQAAEASATNGAVASLQARVMSDPKLMAHFFAIKSLLSADETTQLLALGERMSQEQQEFLIAQISAATPDAAAMVLRKMLAELSEATLTTETK
jgi:hypothetical protein